jgi:hypothetical protein
VTNAPRASRPGRTRTRRESGARESLLSIVLVLEAVMFFFPMLVVFGKHELSPGWAFGGGLGSMVVLALASRMQRTSRGQAIGWALQVLIIVTGLVEPFMYVVGAVFLAMWIYCFVKGGQLDRANAARRAEWESHNPS